MSSLESIMMERCDRLRDHIRELLSLHAKLSDSYNAMKQRHRNLVEACKAWRVARENNYSDDPPVAESELICDLLDEEPIDD